MWAAVIALFALSIALLGAAKYKRKNKELEERIKKLEGKVK